MASPPNTMAAAASKNTSTPRGTLPPVAVKMLSLLKKMPEPTQMPTIMATAVGRPNRFLLSIG